MNIAEAVYFILTVIVILFLIGLIGGIIQALKK